MFRGEDCRIGYAYNLLIIVGRNYYRGIRAYSRKNRMLMYQKSESDFRQQNGITEGEWEIAKMDWSILSAIGKHHEGQKNSLARAAEGVVRDLQSIDRVHSVRFRVKDTDHLLVKIIRKRVEGSEKYADISVDNYQTKLTDLVGVRALHLFKEDVLHIDSGIRGAWELEENPPVAYVREGDFGEKLEDAGFDVKVHRAGYRSVHYIVSTSPGREKILVEIQVRTIFEEGWAEIDHTVKYPNFSDNESVAEFLGIFNRLAGAADEMGSFVRRMTESLKKVNAIMSSEESTTVSAATQDPISKRSGSLSKKMMTEAMLVMISQNLLLPRHDNRKKKMNEEFSISDPEENATGDFLSFTILDSGKKLSGRISRTALAVLRGLENGDDLVIFEKHKEKIRTAAFNILRANPLMSLIAIGSNDIA